MAQVLTPAPRDAWERLSPSLPGRCRGKCRTLTLGFLGRSLGNLTVESPTYRSPRSQVSPGERRQSPCSTWRCWFSSLSSSHQQPQVHLMGRSEARPGERTRGIQGALKHTQLIRLSGS